MSAFDRSSASSSLKQTTPARILVPPGENGVMSLERPGRRWVRGADQSGLVRIVPDDLKLGLEPLVFQQHRRAADGELADAAAGKPAAEHDAVSVFPRLKPEKTAKHDGKLSREGLDRPLHDAALSEQIVELFLGDFAELLAAERILADVAERFAPLVDEAAKRAFAGAVAEKAIFRP